MSDELQKLEPSALLPLIMSGAGDALKSPHAREVYLLSTYIAGSGYVDGITEIFESIEIGDPLTLQREPTNPHDERAIAVYDVKDRRIGYIPRHKNEVFSRLMDAGFILYGKLIDMKTPASWPELTLAIYLEVL